MNGHAVTPPVIGARTMIMGALRAGCGISSTRWVTASKEEVVRVDWSMPRRKARASGHCRQLAFARWFLGYGATHSSVIREGGEHRPGGLVFPARAHEKHAHDERHARHTPDPREPVEGREGAHRERIQEEARQYERDDERELVPARRQGVGPEHEHAHEEVLGERGCRRKQSNPSGAREPAHHKGERAAPPGRGEEVGPVVLSPAHGEDVADLGEGDGHERLAEDGEDEAVKHYDGAARVQAHR